MALIDDIEFYGRAVDAGELTRNRAAALLAQDSSGIFTVASAASWIDSWERARAFVDRLHCDSVEAMRALRNGRPIPAHVERRLRDAGN